jgi:pimeloyl-ACP methyl ester carboxylesterase
LQVIRRASREPPPTLVSAVELSDGRRLCYSAGGPARGYPVVYLHGAIGSPRWRTPALDAVIEALGIRFVVVHRPGFAGSDVHPGRRVASHAADVSELADALGWGRFSVLGVSAGAPYALACAWAMGGRVARTAAVSPFPPPAVAAPRGRLRLRYSVPLAVFDAPGIGPPLAGAVLTAMRLRRATPPRSMVEDYLVCCRDWGFCPEAIRAPVTFWHAHHDRLVPLVHTRALAAAVPAATLEVTPRGGHFFLRRLIAEVVGSLVQVPGYAERGTAAA